MHVQRANLFLLSSYLFLLSSHLFLLSSHVFLLCSHLFLLSSHLFLLSSHFFLLSCQLLELCHQSLLNLSGSLQLYLLLCDVVATITNSFVRGNSPHGADHCYPSPSSFPLTTSAGTPSKLLLLSPSPTDHLLPGLHEERSCYVSTVYTSTTVQCVTL